MQRALKTSSIATFKTPNRRVSCSRRSMQRCTAFMKTHDSQKLIDTATLYYRDLNEKSLDRLETLCCPNIVYSDRVWSDHDLTGLPKLGASLKAWLEAYPDYQVHVDTVLSRDDSNTVAVHWTSRLTCQNDYHGIPATGKRSVVSGMTLFSFNQEDKIHEVIVYRQPTEEERALYLGLEGM